MNSFTRMLLAATLLLAPASSLHAQTPVDPSGHWEGAIEVGGMEVRVVIDLAKNGKGEFAGTFGQPEQRVKGLPLSTVVVESGAVRFVVKGGPDAATFVATLASDGKSMSGEVKQAGSSIPFSLTRTGEAQFAPAPTSAAIGKELEGTWNGMLEVDGRQERLVLKLANQPDGTATGTILDIDGSGVEIPIAVTQKTSNVTIEVASVGGSYVGVLNAGSELVGTWKQGPLALSLTFRRAAATEGRK